jgi:hypothetical protein
MLSTSQRDEIRRKILELELDRPKNLREYLLREKKFEELKKLL